MREGKKTRFHIDTSVSPLSALNTERLCCRRLRSSSTHLLHVPPFHLSTVGRRSFSVAASILWNSLPLNVQSSPFSACLPSTSKDIPLPEVFSWVTAMTVCLSTVLGSCGLRNSFCYFSHVNNLRLTSAQRMVWYLMMMLMMMMKTCIQWSVGRHLHNLMYTYTTLTRLLPDVRLECHVYIIYWSAELPRREIRQEALTDTFRAETGRVAQSRDHSVVLTGNCCYNYIQSWHFVQFPVRYRCKRRKSAFIARTRPRARIRHE